MISKFLHWFRAPQASAVPPAPNAKDVADAAIMLRHRRTTALREAIAGMRAPTQRDEDRPSAWTRPKIFPGVIPAAAQMACDATIDESYQWAAENAYFSEGLGFLGYPYLAELAQRPEYRRISETFAKEMTRKWIRLVSTGNDDGGENILERARDLKRQHRETDASDVERIEEIKQQWAALFNDQDGDRQPKAEKLKKLKAAMKRLKVRDAFRRAAELDGFFGRGHIYIDLGSDDPEELKTPIGTAGSMLTAVKVKKGALRRLQVVEPIWTYPNAYNATNPLQPDYFKPETWFVMGKEIHASRLQTFIGREVPDLLKPMYAFGGLSLSQMAKPYVDNWLRTRQSVSDAISNFSIMVMLTTLDDVLNAGSAESMKLRAELFTVTRDNKGVMLADKNKEDLKNVSMPLSGLHELQAQSQEHICSVTGIPLVKYTGISPTGLNASSEGEIRVFYDWVAAQQEDQYTDPLTDILNVMQLSEFGEIDPEIGFIFEPLWTLDALGQANLRKVEMDTDCEAIDHGIIDASEVRARLAADEDSPYASLDLNKDIEPPEGGEEERSPTTIARDAEWREGDHPRATNGEFGSGGRVANEVSNSHASTLRAYTGAGYREVNGHLRGGKSISDSGSHHIAQLDDMMLNASLPEAKTVYRGLGSLGVQQLLGPTGKTKAGQLIEDPGFVSTSSIPSVAKQFFNTNPSKNIFMHIKLPQGSKAMDVSKYSDMANEAETLIARGAKMKVVKFDPKTRSLEVELMPHNYDPSAKTKKKTAKDTLGSDAKPLDDKFNYLDATGLILHPSDDPDVEEFDLTPQGGW